jgi:hypothetical protein
MDEMEIEIDVAANARNLQYLATKPQGMAICPTSFEKNRLSPFCAS